MAEASVGGLLNSYLRGEVKAGNFTEAEYVPEGTYEVEISVASVKNDRITMFGTVQDGPYAGKKVGLGGVGLTGKTADSTKVVQGIFLQAMEGIFGGKDAFSSFAAQNQTLDQIAAGIKGRKVTVELKDNEWQGEMRNQASPGSFKLISAPAGGGLPAPPAAVPPPAAVAPLPDPVPPPAADATAPAAVPEPAVAGAPTPTSF